MYGRIKSFIELGCQKERAEEFGVYPLSIEKTGAATVFMADFGSVDALVVVGDNPGFSGEIQGGVLVAPLNHENACTLRKVFRHTAPSPVLREKKSMGLGDRLGIASDGHILALAEYEDVFPVLAQQSIRELNLTGRSYEEVLDSASFAVYRCGFKRGFGADGDHLKTEQEIDYALSCGYTMITLDSSEYIDNEAARYTAEEIDSAYRPHPELEQLYMNKTVAFGDESVVFGETQFKKAVLIYEKAIDFIVRIFYGKIQNAPHEVDFEVSIDETATPTEPLHHYFVAAELKRRGVCVATIAPRFIGEFQKGVDYRGDIVQFEHELKQHAAIAVEFGYKLSIHSGSDKFSVFGLIGQITNGNYHVKTAGTNWLEAMRLIAMKDTPLYREVHTFALEEAFDDARKFYVVSTDLTKIPGLNDLTDEQLPTLFNNDDSRQLIHITYGHILNAKNDAGEIRFKDRLYKAWRTGREQYAELLKEHIGKHLKTLHVKEQ